MRKFWIVISVCWLWTCGGGGGGSPTEPDIELPTVQNIEFTIEEDTSKTFAFMGSDPLNRALTYSISTQPQYGTLTINAGAGTYAPNANYYGADTFAYIATNVDGTSNIGTIVATITPVDDEPNSMDVSATTDEDNAIDITLEAEEYDGDNIIFQVRNNPSNGSVSISGTTATYTPNQDWNGTDTFNFEAVDSNAKSVLNVATATITVNPVNDAPTVENIDAGGIQLNESKDITLVGSDAENDNLTYSIVSQPSKGTVTINGNVATYTASLINEDTFTYRAFDGIAYSTNATVNVNNFTFTIFGGTNNEELYSVQQTTDGGYILGGLTASFGNGNYDMYLVKTDANGNEEWSNTIGGANQDEIHSIKQTTDGGFILAGSTYNFGGSVDSYDMYLVKTDANGNEEWSNNFGGSRKDFANSVQQTTDGGYILGGTTQGGDGDFDMYLVKTDANGNEEWSNTIGGTNQDRGNSVQQTTDGGYIIGGLTQSFGVPGVNNMYLVKTDANGNEEWSKAIGFTGEEEIYSVQQTTDGGYILGGYTGSSGNGNYDMYLVKTDANGNEEWSNTIGGSSEETAYSVQESTDGGYIIGGSTQSFGNGSFDMYLVKIDANGNEEWSNTFGASSTEHGRSVKQTTDGGYIIGGYGFQNNGNYDMYLVKTDSQGNQEW